MRLRRCGKFCRSLIHRFTQGFTWLEVRHPLLGDGNTFPTSWISAHTRGAVTDRKTPEATNLDAMACYKCLTHGVQNRPHSNLSIPMGELTEAVGKFFNKIGAGHGEKMNCQKKTGALVA
ncbi:MAG: hypothetical protein RLZZ591_1963 [Pseudomonadota bacterium]